MRLTSRIALVGSARFGLSSPFDCSVYAVDCGVGSVLIDAGCGLEMELIEANLRNDGFDPAAILAVVVTHAHADHAGGCRGWKSRTGCKVIVPAGEEKVIEGGEDISLVLERAKRAGIYPPDYRFPTVQVDQVVVDGEILEFGDVRLKAVQVAGHTPHHMCYWTEMEGRRILFSGDAVLYGGSLLLQNIPGCSLDDYRRDIGKLGGLGIDVLLPGHGIFVMRYGQEHVDRAIEALNGIAIPLNFAALCPKVVPRPYQKEARDAGSE
jgi:glyoxylase-like metal-dependent hydrolase (beta-lactamase superfamily II)